MEALFALVTLVLSLVMQELEVQAEQRINFRLVLMEVLDITPIPMAHQ
jgi:hypothetical protein